MYSRRRADKRASYPSFSLVVNWYLLRRLVYVPCRCLHWHCKMLTAYQLHLLRLEQSHKCVDEKPAFDQVEEEESPSDVNEPLEPPDAYPEVSTDVGRAMTDRDNPREHTPMPAPAQLSPIDDDGDAISNITFLDLDDDWSSNGDELSQHSQPQRFTAGMPRRVFYTCRVFLDHCIRPLRKIRRASF